MTMKAQALDGIGTAILVHRTVRKQLEKLIALRTARRQNTDKEQKDKATQSRKITNLRLLEVELKAARSVTSAPTPAEIKGAKDLIAKINNFALADAARQAALDFFKNAVATADDLRKKTKFTTA